MKWQMDSQLQHYANKCEEAHDALLVAEKKFNRFVAEEKHLPATLKTKSEKRTVAEREDEAYASELWKSFKRQLEELRAEFHAAQRRYAMASQDRLEAYRSMIMAHDQITKHKGV